ncbi:phage tail family protein [Halobacillus sp. A5]|uniref:phage tail family protein n=1 Tax=Halobacillus sp. A5 TaxID=2880263 RepID=UPI0020A6B79F|nr:phage tail family protein [Halobacillus sp. A5]MCP3026599.1 phage tail family protein [Halobacillus sp. A5]
MEGLIITDIIFNNQRGESSTLSNRTSSFLLQSYEGFGEVEAEIQDQKSPYQDGSRLVDTLLQNRPLTIGVLLQAETPRELSNLKQKLYRVFNPKLGEGVLRYERYEEVYEINAVPEGSPSILSGSQNSGPTFQKVLIELIAHDPYWREPQKVSRALRAYEGKFHFPVTFPVQFGLAGDSIDLSNEGHVPCSVTMDIQGPVTNPHIKNLTTGESMKINRALGHDEVLHIDTHPRHKRVEVYRNGDRISNAFGWLEQDYDMLQLEVGKNEIQYMADAGETDAIVAIGWRNLYIGV